MAVVDGQRITFPVDDVNNDGDTVQIILIFEDLFSSGFTDLVSGVINMFVHKYGNISFQYDFDDPLVVPGEFEIGILDIDFWTDKMYDDSPTNYTRKVQCDVKINSSVVFRGYAYEDDMSYNTELKLFRAKFASPIDAINKQAMKDPDTGTSLDPLGYGPAWNAWRFDIILDDIYALAESTYNTVNVRHGWEHGNRKATPLYAIPVDSTFWGSLFWFSTANIANDTLGAQLREWAYEYGSYSGVWGLDPFFVQLWVAHSGNSQTLTDIQLVRKGYKFEDLTYLRYTVNLQPALKQIKGDPNASGIKSKTIEKQIEHYFYDLGATAGSRMWWNFYGDSRDNIYTGRDPNVLNVWDSHTPMLAEFHWAYRAAGVGGDPRYLRSDIFHYPRVNVNPTKHFVFDSRNYFIIGMDINFEKNETIIEASIIP